MKRRLLLIRHSLIRSFAHSLIRHCAFGASPISLCTESYLSVRMAYAGGHFHPRIGCGSSHANAPFRVCCLALGAKVFRPIPVCGRRCPPR